jgi:hypothetical protein
MFQIYTPVALMRFPPPRAQRGFGEFSVANFWWGKRTRARLDSLTLLYKGDVCVFRKNLTETDMFTIKKFGFVLQNLYIPTSYIEEHQQIGCWTLCALVGAPKVIYLKKRKRKWKLLRLVSFQKQTTTW